MKKYILVIDSGVGGLTTLFDLVNFLPNNYVYFADYKNHPYGTMDSKKLQARILTIVAYFSKKFDLSGVILACNTATAVSLDLLRKKYINLKIVGTSPRINDAVLAGCKHILVLSTPNTAKFCKVLNYAGVDVVYKPLDDLATLVEKSLNNIASIKPIVKNILASSSEWADGVVLGCTHYVYLKHIIIKEFSSLKIFDSVVYTRKLCAKLFKIQQKNSIKLYCNTNEGKEHIKVAWKILWEGVCAE